MDTIPPQFTIVQVLELMERTGEGVCQSWADIIAYIWAWRIVVVYDLWQEGGWLAAADIHGQGRDNRFSGPLTLQPVLDFLSSTEGFGPVGCALDWLQGWGWAGIGRARSAWELPMTS